MQEVKASDARTRVLLIGMCDSVHFARWVNSIDESRFDVRIFASSPHRRLHPLLQQKIDKGEKATRPRIGWMSRNFALPLWILDRDWLFGNKLRSLLLRGEYKSFRPELIHAHETQNAGYLMHSSAPKENGLNPRTVLTLYGSDLAWFSKHPPHEAKLSQLMAIVDALQFECDRDLKLAVQLGFKGIRLPRSLAAPAPDIEKFKQNSDPRTLIFVKGYQNKWGRGSKIVEALSLVHPLLAGYHIVIVSAESSVPRLAKKLLIKKGVKVSIFRKKQLSHEQILDLLSKAQLYVASSVSDGLPATLVEALACGAFPIQTSTACTTDWLKPEEHIFEIDNPDSSAEIASKLERALADPQFINDARARNQEAAYLIYATSQNHALASDTYTLSLG